MKNNLLALGFSFFVSISFDRLEIEVLYCVWIMVRKNEEKFE